MQIITVLSQKGGVGKTTTALALATLIAKAGDRTLLVDIDHQATASWWTDHYEKARETEAPFDAVRESDPTILAKLRSVPNHDSVIVDAPGSLRDADLLRSAAAASDFVLLPCRAAIFDAVATIRTVTELVRPLGIPHRVLLTMVDSRAVGEADEAAASLTQAGIPVFTSRVRHLKAHPDGQASARLISDFTDRSSRKALDDYSAVTMELLNELRRTATNPVAGPATANRSA